MTTRTGNRQGSGLGRLVGLLLGAMFVVQAVGMAFGLGGVGDARPRIDRPADAPTLSIRGWALFGGFGIASEEPKERDDHSFASEPIVAD